MVDQLLYASTPENSEKLFRKLTELFSDIRTKDLVFFKNKIVNLSNKAIFFEINHKIKLSFLREKGGLFDRFVEGMIICMDSNKYQKYEHQYMITMCNIP